jgi:cation diffusion facilitator CzcD-associated flavoprotein CzcO
MTSALGPERVETVVIGAGQAGLATGYHLARRGREFVILDANQRIGDAWRTRWDSLRLFTPARYDGLPGWPFPAPACLRSSDLDWVVLPLKRSATVTGTRNYWAASGRQARRLATATPRPCRLTCTPVVVTGAGFSTGKHWLTQY